MTTQRLIHLGRVRVDYSLCEIRDAVEAEGVLRLIVGEDRGIEIDVRDPRLLRVEIAAVREAAHVPTTRASSTSEEPDGSVSADRSVDELERSSLVVAVAGRGFRPVVSAELVEDAADVRLHRPARDRQRDRDVAIAQAIREQAMDVALS